MSTIISIVLFMAICLLFIYAIQIFWFSRVSYKIDRDSCTKKCYKCGKQKEFDEFWRCNSTKDGLQTNCIQCKNKCSLMEKKKFKEKIKKAKKRKKS